MCNFMATDINKVLSDYQQCEFVKIHQHLRDICVPIIRAIDIITLKMGTEMVPETKVFNEQTRLIAQEDFIKEITCFLCNCTP